MFFKLELKLQFIFLAAAVMESLWLTALATAGYVALRWLTTGWESGLLLEGLLIATLVLLIKVAFFIIALNHGMNQAANGEISMDELLGDIRTDKENHSQRSSDD